MSDQLDLLNEFDSLDSAVLASVVGLVYRIKLVHNADSTWASAIVELCLYTTHSYTYILKVRLTFVQTSRILRLNHL